MADLFNLSSINNPFVVIIGFIIVLIPAVIIHELGHFIAAKMVGITILEFGVGMPPRIMRLFTWRGTDVTLNWLPLGGFVRPLGEDVVRQMGDEALQTDRDEAVSRGISQPVSVNEARPMARIFFMAGGAIANFIMAFVLFAIVGMIGLETQVSDRVQVNRIAGGSPAQAAGLLPNDLIIAFNGETISTYEDLQTRTRENLDETVTLTLLRNGEDVEVSLVPRANPPEGQGAMGIEIGPETQIIPMSFGEAVQFSIDRLTSVLRLMAELPSQLVSAVANREAPPENMRIVSPLGISQGSAIMIQQSIEERQPTMILEYIALISFALGITNLLPIPALDGGRILFVIIEIIRGRPIAPEREGMVHLVGLAVLLSLMVVALLNDIANPITNQLR
jgi:regulator of sigma E protease